MSRDSDQLTPTPFEPAPRTADPGSQGAPAAADPSRPWVWPALRLLVLLAAVVVFWLPQPTTERPAPAEDPVASSSPVAPGGSRPQAAREPAATPYADAQQARLRKEAQDVLAQLLEIQEALEELAVEQWAGEAFAAAVATAASGDQRYQAREFVAAKKDYDQALAALQAIEAERPARAASRRAAAVAAIEAREPDTAAAELELATQMQPEHEDLTALEQRLDALPAVISALEQAGVAEEAGRLAEAESALREATESDPAHQYAARELARVADAHRRARFNAAMSEGYAALDDNRFDAAREAFRRAQGLRPEAAEAGSALRELEAAATAHRLAVLRQRGAAAEAAEEWPAAVQRYQEALAIDASVVFAQEGLSRARPRAELHEQLQEVLEQPDRLADPGVAAATDKLLQRARAVPGGGPVLQQQIATLSRALEIANQPVAVTLRSDQQTAVTVYKVARLGTFSERELELRPGSYTAVGTRRGFRDVRRSFTVDPEQPPDPVVIMCTEPI